MRTFSRVLLAGVLLVLFVGGCEPPLSVNPLSDPGTAKADPRLAGVWAANMNGAEVWLHFNPRETGAVVDVLMIGHDPKDGAMVLHYEGFPSQIGGKSYLNLREKTFASMWESAYTVSKHYIFARYDFEKDGSITLSVMDGTPATEAIRKKEIAGATRGESELFAENTLTAESAALATWVEKAGPGLFDKLGTFKRIDPKLGKAKGTK